VIRLVAALAAFALPIAQPTTVAVFPAQVIGVAQDSGSIAWLRQTASGCELDVRSPGGAEQRTAGSRADCVLAPADLALAAGRAAWGGYQDVNCGGTDAAVNTAAGSAHPRQVQQILGDCLGYATAYQGLTSDGRSFLYALLVTRPESASTIDCGQGGRCSWQLAGGRIVRISGSHPHTIAGMPPAALLAGASGRVALVEPARSASSNGRSASAFDWPRAALDGTVQIRDTTTVAIVSSFRPSGTVRAVALSARRAAVLVESAGGARRIEWYDVDSGARLGTVAVPAATDNRLSTDGRYVAFAVGDTVRVLDLETREQRIVRRAASVPVGLSISNGRLVWGENSSTGGRVLSEQA
jgi:hypothetical protein